MRKQLLSILLTLCLVLTLLPGTVWASAEDGQIDLRPTNETRWIDRVELPDFALKLYETLEKAIDGDGCSDYLIDDEYFDLDAENVPSNGEPGDFIRGNVSLSDGSVFRYSGIVVTTTETPEKDHNYISNCITAVHTAFKRDHPEAFWLQGKWQVSFIRNGIRYYCYAIICRTVGETTPYYDMRVPEFRPDGGFDIRRAIARRDEDIETILRTIPSGADRFTQVWHLNDWLAEHNSYNVKEGGYTPWYATQCISALEGLEGTDGPVCGGYATAFQVLCQALDIPCVFVHAQKPFDPDHGWNYVQMENGNWYAVDATWNDGGDHAENRTKWFLVGGKTMIDEKAFLVSHPAKNPADPSKKTEEPSGVADFINGPVLSDNAYPRKVHLAYTGMPEKLNSGDSVTLTPVLLLASGAAYTYSSTGLPAGLTLDRDTGKITGVVLDASNAVTLTVTAVNPDDPADRAQCTLTFPAEESHKFVDVPDWGAAEVNWGAAKGIILGVGENRFASYNTCTHDEILTFLWRTAGRPEAAQSPVATAYNIPDFQDAINWAYEKRMIDTSFQSRAPCTRASAVKYIWQATGMKSAPASDFSDVPSSAAYAPAVDWAAANGITMGTGNGRFNPDGTCTRVQIAVFLYRAYHNIETAYSYADMEQQIFNSPLKRKASFTFTNSGEESLDHAMVDL